MGDLSYQGYYKKLFKNEDASKDPYTVNPLFYNMYDQATTFQSIAKPEKFMRNVSSFTIYTQREADTLTKTTSSSPVFAASTTTNPPTTLLRNNATVPPVATIAPNMTADYGVFVEPSYHSYFLATYINTALDAIDAENQNFALSSSRARARYNEDFSAYLNLIMLSICRPFYSASRPLLNTYADVQNSPKMYETCQELSSLNSTRFINLRDIIQDTMFSTLVKLAASEPEANDNDNLRDLQVDSGFTRSFYYKLRTQMVRSLVIPERVFYTTDTEVADYFKKLAVDHYLKTMYPVVQYSYLGAMNERYKKRGDFVNMRWCVFTMVSYVYEWVKVIEKAVQDAASTSPPATIMNPSMISTQSTARLQSIFNNIKHYMTTINTNFLPGSSFSATATGESSTKAHNWR